MFAGKTARLIELLRAARLVGREVRAFKHRLDARYDLHQLMTHDGRSFPAVAVETATEIITHSTGADVVGIDEAQFFGVPLVTVCSQLVAVGASVIVAGIHHDAWGQDFPPLPQLAEIADEVETFTCRCTGCGRPAEYSQRTKPVADENMVGGPQEYEPRCRACFVPLPPAAPR
jgi:thymidine kinase